MMQFGCGAHMVHGHGDNNIHKQGTLENVLIPSAARKFTQERGYDMMHEGNLYRFCSRHYLDEFDGYPSLFVNKHLKETHHEH